jgi:hypothetical protein
MAEQPTSKIGDVRAHPDTGFRQVLTKRGLHARWIDTPEETQPGQVLHFGFAKDSSSLTPQETEEVRSQATGRAQEAMRPVSVNSMGKPTAQKAPSITEQARAAGKPVKKQSEIVKDANSHIDSLASHITGLKSHLSGMDLPEDHPAVKAVDEASDYVAGAGMLLHGENSSDKESFAFHKRPNADAVAAGRENPRENKTEAENALTSVTAATAHAHRLLSSKAVLGVEGVTSPPVPKEAVQDNYEHAKTFQMFGHKSGRAGNVSLAGTTIYGNDAGVRGAIARVRQGKKNGEYSATNLQALIRNLRGTKRFTAGQLAEQGITRQEAAKSVEWNGVARKEGMQTGSAGVATSGTRPWSGREGDLGPNAGDSAPRSGMARPEGAVQQERVSADAAQGEATRAAGSTRRGAADRSAAIAAFREQAGGDRVRASQNAAENKKFQENADRDEAVAAAAEKIQKRREGTGGTIPQNSGNSGARKAAGRARRMRNGN